MQLFVNRLRIDMEQHAGKAGIVELKMSFVIEF